MWNFYSLGHWEYTIPFVHTFEVFEMPLLGYAGYLPFGLECVAVVEIFLSVPKNEPWLGEHGLSPNHSPQLKGSLS